MKSFLLSIALATAALPVLARDPILRPPLDCDFATTCFIPRFVDVDPSPGEADFMCGPLTGDGHKGTDFAVASLAELEAGVPVTASAPGTVRAIRDGEPDRGDGQWTEGRECGNGVVLSHGDGWETQYCHLRNGSIAVSEGQRVSTATVLGLVGLSGQTTFPHVHLSVRRNGEVVDPFAPEAVAQCGEAQGADLWREPLPYRPGGLIAAGFWDAVPTYEAVKAGDADRDSLPADAPALVLWGYAFGGRTGDEITLSITGPGGSVIDRTEVVEKGQPLFFRAAGRRTPDGGWPEGAYTGEVTLRRDGAVLERRDATLVITPGLR